MGGTEADIDESVIYVISREPLEEVEYPGRILGWLERFEYMMKSRLRLLERRVQWKRLSDNVITMRREVML